MRPLKVRVLVAALLLAAPPALLELGLPFSASVAATAEAPLRDSHVVIAVIDTGINPYHRAFAAPALTAPPSSYLPGFPADAQALDVCKDCSSLTYALLQDRLIWEGPQSVEKGKLYWFPGTRIIGAISLGESDDGFTGPHRILDDAGHGTATASLAAGGSGFGQCPECLLVIVEGPGDAALAWARDQPWIDVVSNSWGLIANLDWPPPPFGEDNAALTKDMVQRGQTVLFSAGNGLGNHAVEPASSAPDYLLPGESTYTSEYTGPDWVITVGAADPQNGQPIAGTGRPVDIAAAGLHTRAAHAFSLVGSVDFSGTSASAPIAAGVFGNVLLQLRRALGDAQVGPRAGEVVAQGVPPTGILPTAPIADGVLTRDELQRLVFSTARPCPLAVGAACPGLQQYPFPVHPWGWTLPSPPVAYPLEVGYGVVDATSRDAAVRVGLGQDVMPVRLEADLWAHSDSIIRQRLWGDWDHGARWNDVLPT